MAYKFLKSRQLRKLLDGAEGKQKKDISDYAGGHLNESVMLQQYAASNRKPWETARPADSLVERSQLTSVPPPDNRPGMQQALYDFSLGTAGVVPPPPPPRHKNRKPSLIKRFKFLRESKPKSDGGDGDSSKASSQSARSLYSEMDDGVLIEELPPAELMLKRNKKTPLPKITADESLTADDATFTTGRTSVLSDHQHQPQRRRERDGDSGYKFVPMHSLGVTRQDQYRKMRSFEAQVMKKREAREQNVLSGIRAVEHHERKLKKELSEMTEKAEGGIDFQTLQIHSDIFEDIIHESPTFSYILRCVKTEYDNYITWLLDNQPAQQHLLQEQVLQMELRGTSRPQELQLAQDRVARLTQEAQEQLARNQRLHKDILQERELLKKTPEPTQDVQRAPSVPKRDQPLELADEIEALKVAILEKLDEESALRVRLREEFVPLTVCTHLEQCIKETEVEIQKLLKQNEYFERSIDEMETELKEAIQEADTSEKDARRIWRKVNAKRGLPGHQDTRSCASDDEEEEEESKWNWYIS